MSRKLVRRAVCSDCAAVREYAGNLRSTMLKCASCGRRTHHVVDDLQPAGPISTWERKADQENRQQLHALARLLDLCQTLGIVVEDLSDRSTKVCWLFAHEATGQVAIRMHPRLSLERRVHWLQIAVIHYVSHHADPVGWSWPGKSDASADEQRAELERTELFPARWLDGGLTR